MLNGDAAGGGNNSAEQGELSALLSGSAAAFAYTGNLTVSDGRVQEHWPTAYGDQSQLALKKEYPEQMNVFVVGGPYGNVPAKISADTDKGAITELANALAWEKLIERCRFINSIQEETGV